MSIAGSLEFVLKADTKPLEDAAHKAKEAVTKVNSTAARGLDTLDNSAKAATKSMSLLRDSMTLIGYRVAPQLADSLMMVANAAGALKATYKLVKDLPAVKGGASGSASAGSAAAGAVAGNAAAGTTAAAAGAGSAIAATAGIAAAAVGTFYILSSGIDAVRAKLADLRATQSTMAQQEEFAKRLQAGIHRAMDAKQLGKDLGEELLKGLAESTNLDQLRAAVQRAQKELRTVTPIFTPGFSSLKEELQLRTLDPKSRAIAEADLERQRLWKQALKESEGANLPRAVTQEVFENIEQVYKQRLEEIEKQFAAQPPPLVNEPRSRNLRPGPTDLERIGLVIGLPGSLANDFARRTAENTQRTVAVLHGIQQQLRTAQDSAGHE